MHERDEERRPMEAATTEAGGLVIGKPYLLFLGDVTDEDDAKTALGLRDWCPRDCVGQLRLPCCTVTTELPDLTPAQAVARGARSLVIGVAPMGGVLSPRWVPALRDALEAGLDVVSGMHSTLADEEALVAAARRNGRRIVEIRRPKGPPRIGTGRKRSGRRLLTVGTDCALGKKYAALAIAQELERRRIPTDFRATGQTGILISGRGVPVDAVVADFVAGAAESLSPDAASDHWDVVEGQGALLHPSYAGVTLGLLHGSQPDAFVVCHDPLRRTLSGLPDMPIPAVESIVRLTIELGRVTNPAIRCVGVSLNTMRVPDAERDALHRDYERRLGVPSFDPLRGGVDRVVDRMLGS